MPILFRLRALFLALVVLALFGSGCGASGGMAPAEAASPAGAAPSPEPAAVAAAATAEATWQRSQIRSNTARLAIGDREQLPLVGMQMTAAVDGFRARVVLDCYFLNDHDQQYEGNFQLRLPNEASPYFFAFGQTIAESSAPPPYFGPDAAKTLGVSPARILADRAASWSEPQEARMVPKEKAAFAYGQTVRRRVDPGIVEWAGAGIFNARVFPLAPRKVHRIVIAYDVDLLPVGHDLEFSLDVPENAPNAVVDLSVQNAPNTPVEVAPKAPASSDSGRSRYRFESPKERSVTVRLKKPGTMALTGTDERTGAYFAVGFRPDLPSPASPKDAQGPDAAVFLVDTSLSSNPDRFNVWLKLLKATLDNNRDTLKRFAVAFFNIETLWYKPDFTENTSEATADLLTFARTLSLEGATDLGAAFSQAAAPPWLTGQSPSAWDVFLLSDGAATWGSGDRFGLSRKLGGKPGAGRAKALYAYQTGMSGTDTGVLEHVTRESGGAVFSVVSEAEVAKASTAHRTRPFQLVSVEVSGGSDILVAGRPRSIFPGQHLMLAGRGSLPKDAEIGLTIARDGQSRVIRTKIGAPLPSPLASRIFGQIAVAQLEELDTATEKLATAYATYFRVTGKTCSLLLLETEADYQRQGLQPEDPGTIQQSSASETVNRALQAIGASLGDPKAGFLAWLDGLPRKPGMNITVPKWLRDAANYLPASKFAVDAPSLTSRLHDARKLPPAFVNMLVKHQLDYDAVSAEAERRKKQAGPADALKALSSLVEENPGDSVLARDVAFSAMQWGFGGQAYHLFQRVAAARPYEPQTYRAMASCLVGMNQIDLAMVYYEVGLLGQWDGRFGDFHQILGMEYLHLLRRIAGGEVKTSIRDFALGRLTSLERQLRVGKADLVVMITWNTDNTDVDLHVVEPNGEECYYSHRRTSRGGDLTQDVTQGYGPEMYVIPQSEPGNYVIQAHYFASDQNRASVRTKVQALVFENWGTPKERVTDTIVTLEQGKAKHLIAVVGR
jgi:hypothetical protein